MIPGVVFVSGFSTHVYVVPLGKPSVLILPSALGSLPCFAVEAGCFAVGVFFALIEDTVIFADLSLKFPALSSTRMFKVNSLFGVFSGSFSTVCFPALNLITLVKLSYSK